MDKRSFNWFLTYPQCNLKPEDFNEALWNNSNVAECSGFAVSREKHADGGIHYHVLLCYKKTKRVRSLLAFDLSHLGVRIHGKYEVVKNLRDCYGYVIKDGDYYEDIESIPGLSAPHEPSYWELSLQAQNKERALEIIRRNNPREYILNRKNLEYAFDKHFEVREELAPPAYERASFTNVPGELDQWVWDELTSDKPRKKALFLIGPSRTGKTSWARSIGQHIYCMSALIPSAVKNKPKDIEYILFDDIEQSTLDKSQLSSCWRVFVGCQGYLTVNEKYKPQETVNWGIPSIWCLNKMLHFNDMDFMERNSIVVNINENLY